jgi:hypothetical protein
MTFVLHGYSERGMIWTLFGEMARREDGNDLLTRLLTLITPPITDGDVQFSLVPTVMIEQSLSDFGDADVLLLLGGPPRRSVFIEAKVCCGTHWTFAGELARFRKGSDSIKKAFSNLFCQLYAKQRLIETLKSGAIPADGVEFLEGFKRRKIGKNRVVHRAVDLLRSYVQESNYVALVPDPTGFDQAIAGFEAATGRACARWSVLSWEQLKMFCQSHSLDQTLRAFDHNRSQIF